MRNILTLVLLCCLLAGTAAAAQVTDIEVEPDETVWQGRPITVQAACLSGAQPYVDRVSIDTATQEYIYNLASDDLPFTNGSIGIDRLRPYLLYPGDYSLRIVCQDETTSDTATATFTLRRLHVTIPQDELASLYSGNRSWLQVNITSIDRPGRNPASVTAFADGVRRSLYIDINRTEHQFAPTETVTINGSVASPLQPVVATVSLDLSRSSLTLVESTDTEGRFSFEFPVPNQAGGYTVRLTASRQDYLTARTSFGFRVTRQPVLRTVFQDTVNLSDTRNTTVTGFVRNVGNEPAEIDNITAEHPYVTDVAVSNRTVHPNQIVNVSIALDVPAAPASPNTTIPVTFAHADGNTTVRFTAVTGTAATTAPSGLLVVSQDFDTGILKYLVAALLFLAGAVFLIRQYSGSRDRPVRGPGESSAASVDQAVTRIKSELD